MNKIGKNPICILPKKIDNGTVSNITIIYQGRNQENKDFRRKIDTIMLKLLIIKIT